MITLHRTFVAAVLLAATPAFCAPQDAPGDPPPPPPSERNGGTDLSNISTIGGPTIAGDVFAMMLEYQKILNKEHREDRKIARQDARLQLELAEKRLERDRAALLAMDDAKQRMQTLDDLRSKTMDAAVAAVPKTASLRDKAISDVFKAEEASIAKAIKAAESLPADRRQGEFDLARARAEKNMDLIRQTQDHFKAMNDQTKDFLRQLQETRQALDKDRQTATVFYAR